MCECVCCGVVVAAFYSTTIYLDLLDVFHKVDAIISVVFKRKRECNHQRTIAISTRWFVAVGHLRLLLRGRRRRRGFRDNTLAALFNNCFIRR